METYLLVFPPRAFALGDASVQRDLCRKMKKMDLMAEAKETSEMEVDSTTAAPPAEPLPSSSTIAALIDKRVSDALKEIKGLLSAPSSTKKGAVESKSPPHKRKGIFAETNLPCRKKVSRGYLLGTLSL